MKKAIPIVAIVLLIGALLLTVLNKGWWMKKLRSKFALPWPPDQDKAQAKNVSLGALIRMVHTDVDYQGGNLAEHGPPTAEQDKRFDDILRTVGFAW